MQKSDNTTKVDDRSSVVMAIAEGRRQTSGLLDVARQTYISLHDAIQLKFLEYENNWKNIDGLKLHNTKTRGHHLSVPIRYIQHLDDKDCKVIPECIRSISWPWNRPVSWRPDCVCCQPPRCCQSTDEIHVDSWAAV